MHSGLFSSELHFFLVFSLSSYNIKAIVTGKPNDFSKELNIISLSDLKTIQSLERNFLKDAYDLSAVLVINLEKALDLPSYTGIKLLKPNKSSHKLDITYSSDKVSTASTNKLSSQSTYARSISQILLDVLLNTSTAPVDITKLGNLESERLTCKYSPHTLKASIDRDLPITSSARSTAHIDVTKLDDLGLGSLICKGSIHTLKASIDRDLPITSSARSTAHIDVTKLDDLGLGSLTCKGSIHTLKASIGRSS